MDNVAEVLPPERTPRARRMGTAGQVTTTIRVRICRDTASHALACWLWGSSANSQPATAELERIIGRPRTGEQE